MKCTKCEMINIYDISLYDESIIEFYSQCANCLKITEHDEFKYGPNNPELFTINFTSQFTRNTKKWRQL